MYLPEGNWYRYGTDEMLKGNTVITVESPVYDLPVFVAAGAVIAMQPVVQHTGETPGDTLHLHVYKTDGMRASFYYEDDGSTYEYEHGKYHQRTIMYDGTKKELKFSAVEGNRGSKFKQLKIVGHGFENKQEIVVDYSNKSFTIALQ